MPIIGAGVGAAGNIVGGIMANKANKKAMAAAEAALANARRIIDEVGPPPDLSGEIIIDQLKQAGVLTPEMEGQIRESHSKLSLVKEDQDLRTRQKEALSMLKDRTLTGLTPEERGQLNKSRADVQRDLEAKQQQIIQGLQARGQAGGGAEIAARLGASQAGADRASEEADRIQAMSFNAKQQAIQNLLGGASQVRGQDFQIEGDKARAEDVFEQFNVQNQIGRQQRNIDRANVGQEFNLKNLQRIQDTNADMRNQEKYRQADAKRQFWADRLSYAQARANPFAAQANMELAKGQQKAQFISGIANSLGGFGSSAFANSSSASSGGGSSPLVRGSPGQSYDTSQLSGFLKSYNQ